MSHPFLDERVHGLDQPGLRIEPTPWCDAPAGLGVDEVQHCRRRAAAAVGFASGNGELALAVPVDGRKACRSRHSIRSADASVRPLRHAVTPRRAPVTPWLCASSTSSVASTTAAKKSSWSERSVHSLSKCGCSALQCPHQGAKNTTSAFLPLMAASKLPVSREETQLPSPISPSSAAAALIRQAATARSKTLGARRDGRMLRVFAF